MTCCCFFAQRMGFAQLLGRTKLHKISMTTEEHLFTEEKDGNMWLKAPETSSKWTLRQVFAKLIIDESQVTYSKVPFYTTSLMN